MINFITLLFSPRFNKFIIWGFVLMILGFILLPVLIGLTLLIVGSFLFTIGSLISIVKKFPGGNKLVGYYQDMFKRMFVFLKTIIKEGFK